MNQSFAFTVAIKAGPNGIEYVEAAESPLFAAEPGASVRYLEVGIIAPFEIKIEGKEPRLSCAWRADGSVP